MIIVETARLALRHMTLADAPWVLALLNEPSFLRYIGDKKVRTLEDARAYLQSGPIDSYARFNFGLYLTELKDTRTPIGMCGLVKRETLKDVDLGFAFSPPYWKQGYAFEAASAVLTHAKTALALQRLVAITTPDNAPSIALLNRLGFHYEETIQLTPTEPPLHLLSLTL